MTVQFDMSEVKMLAADLIAAAPASERAATAALNKAAAIVAVGAKATAPVDTGELRNSIGVTGDKDSRTISATAAHASFVEFGTSDTPPQPFMWPQVGLATRSLADDLADIDPLNKTAR